MQIPNHSTEVAQQLGYPSSLFGFTPNDSAYWREPGLPALDYLPIEPIEGPDQDEPTAEFIFVTDRMAPRFPDGTVVALAPVNSRHDLVVGRVYVLLAALENGELPVGRLARVDRTSLELTQDNHPAVLTWALGAEAQMETQAIYEVTHYSLYLPHNEARVPAASAGVIQNEGRPVLLEVTTDAMAPAYPQGACYFIQPVPPDQWAQARGVHALVLDNGTWVVRRLTAPASKHNFVLGSDRTGDMLILATREVVSVWVLGAVVHLPEESKASVLAPETVTDTDGDQPYLLELAGNHMGPRYPTGARYLVRLVPRERWTQSRGVHALRLRDGRMLVARLIGLKLDRLVLRFDDTGQVDTVALAELDQLWKLGEADYLPEETEAEHLLVVQQPVH